MSPHGESFILRLYVNGRKGRGRQAIDNLTEILEEHAPGQYELEVIDIREHPEALERDQILATPTLLKSLPEPLARIVGDLSDELAVLAGIDFPARV